MGASNLTGPQLNNLTGVSGMQVKQVFSNSKLAVEGSQCNFLIPGYWYPTNGTFGSIVPGTNGNNVYFIINPSSGPGASVDSNYVVAVQALQAMGVRVLGYVDTALGTATGLSAQFTSYLQWYGIDGIYLDHVSTDLADYGKYLSWYNEIKQITTDIKVNVSSSNATYQEFYVYNTNNKFGGIVVANCGANTYENMLNAADIIVTFEGTYASYLSSWSPAAWVSKYNPWRFSTIVYSAPTNLLYSIVEKVKNRTGTVYITDGTSNFTALPTNWKTLINMPTRYLTY